MLTIDGSLGEGGGQVLRTSVGLSAVTGKDIKVVNIRLGREKKGLRPQHAAGVRAVAELCGAEVTGVHEGSTEITFKPHEMRKGKLKIDVGTAGSVTLVLQALLFPAFFAREKMAIEVRGGTDVSYSPSVDYMRNVLLPLIGNAGFGAEMELVRRGYYPSGGGKVSLNVLPASELSVKPFGLESRGRILRIKGVSHAHKELGRGDVVLRQAKSARMEVYNVLSNHGYNGDISIMQEYHDTDCYGSGITLWAETEKSVLGSVSLGEKRKRAEDVGREAGAALLKELISDAAVDVHMADQLIPYVAVAGGKVRAREISMHAATNMEVVNKFGFNVQAADGIISGKGGMSLLKHP